MIWMSTILGVLFLGITFLLREIGGVPSVTETVISQLARTVFNGQGLLYLSGDLRNHHYPGIGYQYRICRFSSPGGLTGWRWFSAAPTDLPRQPAGFLNRVLPPLGVIASLLVFLFHASVTALVPLWAIGVFLSFTLSQTGMAHRWWKIGHLAPGEEVRERGSTLRYEPGWRLKMVVNGFGAVVTAVVTIVFAATKFRDGAWIVVLLIPGMVAIFFAIHRHYRNLAASLSLKRDRPRMHLKRHRVILPISGVHEGTLAALHYARLLSD